MWPSRNHMPPARKLLVTGAVGGLLLVGAIWLAAPALLPKTSVAAAFDNPPQWPGYTWSRNGQQASQEEIASAAGSSHCNWKSATFLSIGWPLGSRPIRAQDARLFIRDPHGVVSRTYQQQWLKQAALPADAYDTGFRLDAIALYLSSSDPDGAYLKAPAGTERWPFASGFQACV